MAKQIKLFKGDIEDVEYDFNHFADTCSTDITINQVVMTCKGDDIILGVVYTKEPFEIHY